METKRLFFGLATIALAMILIFNPLTGLSADFSQIPLPDDLKITPPDDACPSELKPLSGKWAGEWVTSSYAGAKTFPVILVIQKIEKSAAHIIYAWGETSQNEKGWYEQEAEISLRGKKIYLFFISRDTTRKFQFQLKHNKLEGEAVANTARGQYTNTITMSRIP